VTLVLYWDIDGTLLTTARAGIFAWEEATREVLGRVVDFSELRTAGMTDVEIAAGICSRFGGDTTRGQHDDLVRRYEHWLPRCLPRREGSVLPGVREVLEHVRGRHDVVSVLLTGNTRAGARAKLAHYGLSGYFAHGAFSDGAPDRPTIARTAFGIAAGLLGGPPAPDRSYVIGDTPHDIACARAIGARAVAVSSGSYSVEALQHHEPWWVLDRLPDPETFVKRLEGVPG
jgi:phosphoglycolate phosphatase-like HAD superfamily hydrolase